MIQAEGRRDTVGGIVRRKEIVRYMQRLGVTKFDTG